jgi:arylsulfatase A-like enzyme
MWVLAALLALWGPVSPGSGADDRPHNLLFLFTDDQRADTVHALGNATIATPNLDALARRGMVFRNAYCMGGDVAAVCLPSRTMLLSGRSLFRLKGIGSDSPTLPRVMNEAGYVTYHHGKRGNTPQQIQQNFQINKYLKNDQDERNSGHPGKEIADEAIAFLKERPKDRPFFMYLAFGNPHDPRVVVDEYRRKYDDATMPLPANYRPFHPFDNGELTVRDEALLPWPRTPEAVRKELGDYYGVITYLDMQIGRIMQALKESGEEGRTLVVFSSDQGLALGSQGLMGKQNLYEDGMKVPLILAGPGVPRGESKALVYLFDLPPTFCELVGTRVSEGLDGLSFAQVIRGTKAKHRDAIFLAYRGVQRAVREGDWKMIRYPRINKSQIFDLRSDPHETKDLADDPSQQGRIDHLTMLMQEQQRVWGDTLPLTSESPEPAEYDPATLRPGG